MTTGSVLVTGAGSGIGAAVARRLAADGLHVVCVDVDDATVQQTASQISALGQSAHAVTADVSDADDCARVADELSALTPLVGLCNVAGICPYGTSIMTTSEQTWDRVLAVNLKSIFLLSVACMPHLVRAPAPTIVNTASVHAFAAHPESAPYAASKGAIVALTRQMAVDLAADGVRVVAVAPGAVDTPMTRAAAATLGSSLDELGFADDPAALGRLGSAAEVADVYAWLLGPGARFVNGTTVVADGGLLAQLPGGAKK